MVAVRDRSVTAVSDSVASSSTPDMNVGSVVEDLYKLYRTLPEELSGLASSFEYHPSDKGISILQELPKRIKAKAAVREVKAAQKIVAANGIKIDGCYVRYKSKSQPRLPTEHEIFMRTFFHAFYEGTFDDAATLQTEVERRMTDNLCFTRTEQTTIRMLDYPVIVFQPNSILK